VSVSDAVAVTELTVGATGVVHVVTEAEEARLDLQVGVAVSALSTQQI
jgi:hypothetical protein